MDMNNKHFRLPDGFAVTAGLLLLLAMGLFAAFWPQNEFIDHERRFRTSAPGVPSLTDWTTDGEIESYLSDRVPFRRALVAVDSSAAYLTGRRTQLETWPVDGRYLEQPVAGESSTVEKRLSQMEAIAQNADAPWRVIVPPTHGSLLRAEMPALMRTLYDAEAQLASHVESDAHAIPLRAAFEALPDAYYLTDHHWTLTGAYAAYAALCEADGLVPLPLDSFELSEFSGFQGTTYSRSGMPLAAKDTLRCAQPAGVTLAIPETGETFDTLIFPAQAATYDGYAVYMNGNHGYAEILNPAAPEGTLLVFKDSFANCLLPLLSAHYDRIVLVDARYYSGNFSDAVSAAGAVDEVLFVYSLDSLVNDTVVARKIAR